MQLEITSGKPKSAVDSCWVLLHDDKRALGTGPEQASGDSAVATVKRRFDASGDHELSVFTEIDGQSCAVLFLSLRQVKFQTRLESLKVLGARAAAFAKKHKLSTLLIPLDRAKVTEIAAVAEGIQIGTYTFDRYKSSAKLEKFPNRAVLGVAKADATAVKNALRRVEIVTKAINTARDLINEPAQAIYPETLAQAAKALAEEHGLGFEVMDEKALRKGNFEGVLTVGKGSNRPPRLIVLRYQPRSKTSVHLGLVGKAVAFDTGGYSIKPAKDMWEMKGDMSGGAAVIAAMAAIAQLKIPIRVTAVIPSVINAVSSTAALPGDIIKSRSGKTVHVDNTDAEGRLILMDALDYVQDEKATHVVDAATLTGSIVRAIGTTMSGLFGNDDALMRQIADAGAEAGEQYWKMPMVDEYRAQLDHPVADIDNVGKGPNGGSITAALFLREFIRPETKWAHLDIAGTALLTGGWKYFGPGGTGVGIRTFVGLAEKLAAAPAPKQGGKAKK